MDPTILDFLLHFSSILWEAMPFIVLGAVVAGILEEFLPQQALTKFLPKSVLPAVMIGALLGLVFPMCECGIVVVMRRLLAEGAAAVVLHRVHARRADHQRRGDLQHLGRVPDRKESARRWSGCGSGSGSSSRA